MFSLIRLSRSCCSLFPWYNSNSRWIVRSFGLSGDRLGPVVLGAAARVDPECLESDDACWLTEDVEGEEDCYRLCELKAGVATLDSLSVRRKLLSIDSVTYTID